MDTTIAVIDASIGETPAEQNLRRELDTAVDAYKVSDGQFPPAVGTAAWSYDGVVITGSQTAVYDDHDWIDRTTEWFRSVHEAGVPTLGICWGHQFIAQALGGRVVDAGEYELGYREIERAADDPLFAGLPERFTSFETHSDEVAELPPGATELARNEFTIQAFRVDDAWGVQFHPEYDRQTAIEVTTGKDLPEERIQQVLDGITDEAIERAERTKRLFENLRAIVTEQIDGPRAR